MPISRSNSRKVLLERFLSRMSVSLCWMSGWVATVTSRIASPLHLSLEYRAVADDANGRNALRSQRVGERAAGRPGTALKETCKRKRSRVHTQSLAHPACQFVQQRDSQCAPLHHQRRSYVVLLHLVCKI